MRRWIATVAGMLAAAPAVAAETTVDWGLKTGAEPRTLCVYDTSPSHTCVPVGQLDSTLHSFGSVCNVIGQGADPTGVADSSAAFTACGALTANGQKSNIYVPAGTYLLRQQVTVSDQCLYGDSKANSILHVDQLFNSSADSVIKLVSSRVGSTGNSPSPCIHDIDIQFDQPSDQASRANFLTLAAGCTGGLGGTGCQYPPAIYNDHVSNIGSRPRIYNVRIERAWDGINLQSASGMMIDNIEEGSLNVGLTLANGFDFGHVSHWEHHSSFGIGATAALYTGVYSDGANFAAVIHESDGIVVSDFRDWRGRIRLDTGFSWGTFIGLMLDGTNATLDIAYVTQNQIGFRLIGGYQSGASTGANTDCPIQVDSTVNGNSPILISDFALSSASGTPSLCVASGAVSFTGGSIVANSPAMSAVSQTGGQLQLDNVIFNTNNVSPYTASIVNQTGGNIRLTDNVVLGTPQAGSVSVFSLTDTGLNYVVGNALGTWTFAAPGALGTYGPNGRKCAASGATPKACNGWSGTVTTNALATVALTSASYVITDTAVSASSLIKCEILGYSGTMGTNGVPVITQCVPTASTITANIFNSHNANALNGTVTIGFTVQ